MWCNDAPVWGLKASIPLLYANSNQLNGVRRAAAFPVEAIPLKKPSLGPKGLIGSPCHGAPLDPTKRLFIMRCRHENL
jgi:hypothetical protein